MEDGIPRIPSKSAEYAEGATNNAATGKFDLICDENCRSARNFERRTTDGDGGVVHGAD